MRANFLRVVLLLVFSGLLCHAQTTIQQELLVSKNEGVVNGVFTVQVHVRGSNLPVNNTVGSMTIDLIYNNAALQYVDATSWAVGYYTGYTADVSLNTTTLRIGVINAGVGTAGTGIPGGFDIKSTDQLLVELNFKIINTAERIDFAIDSKTNQIGFFATHANNPRTGTITDQTLNTPIVFGGVALPVELHGFGAEVKKNSVLLAWKTATEVNNFGFDVERSECSATGKYTAWTKLGFVSGAGTTNSSHEYSYSDRLAYAAVSVKYRLKQIDNSGEFSYSKEIEVSTAAPSAYALGQNYPNPFNPSTVINFEIPVAGAVALSIYNVLGEKIADAANAYYAAGHHTIEFNAAGLSSGMYFYRLAVNGMSITKKMHVLK